MEVMSNDEPRPSISQADHDRLAILERLAMTPTERVRTNAAMYAIWARGQIHRREAIARRHAERTDEDAAGT
jgi:hypothetical protein